MYLIKNTKTGTFLAVRPHRSNYTRNLQKARVFIDPYIAGNFLENTEDRVVGIETLLLIEDGPYDADN